MTPVTARSSSHRDTGNTSPGTEMPGMARDRPDWSRTEVRDGLRTTWHQPMSNHLLPYASISGVFPVDNQGDTGRREARGAGSWKEPSPCPRDGGRSPRSGEVAGRVADVAPGPSEHFRLCGGAARLLRRVSRSSGQRESRGGTPLGKAGVRREMHAGPAAMTWRSVHDSAHKKGARNHEEAHALVGHSRRRRAGGPASGPGQPAHAQTVFQAAGPTAASSGHRRGVPRRAGKPQQRQRPGAARQRSPRDQLGRWGHDNGTTTLR